MTFAAQLRITDARRLALVGGCLAAAAAANYGSTMPQRAPVAVAAAFLGILLMLRRRPRPEVEPIDEATPTAASAPTRSRRAGREELETLAATLATVERRLEGHEDRLTSLSGRQSLLQVEARERLADFVARLAEIERRLDETEEQTRLIRAHHIDLLRRLNSSLVDAVASPRADTSP